MVARQLELILEGCLSKLLISRSTDDIATARRLAEDVLTIARCRKTAHSADLFTTCINCVRILHKRAHSHFLWF